MCVHVTEVISASVSIVCACARQDEREALVGSGAFAAHDELIIELDRCIHQVPIPNDDGQTVISSV